MFRLYIPFWIAGVIFSFFLPISPSDWITWGMMGLVWMVSYWHRQALLFLCFLMGMVYGLYRTELALDAQWPLEKTELTSLEIMVADLPRMNEKRIQFVAEAKTESGKSFSLLLSDYQLRDWPVGSRWIVAARVRPVIGEVNVRGLNREAWALANDVDGIGTLDKNRKFLAGESTQLISWREKISKRWQDTPTYGHQLTDGIALMRALSIGEQSALGNHLWQAFQPLGLNHLVSISGLHVSMVAMLFGWLVKKGLFWLPMTPAKPRLWILIGGLSAAFFYAILAGFSVPTQRSVLMLMVFAWAWWRGHFTSGWENWWQALALVVLLEPLAVLSVGTWLSFGLVGALLWVSTGRLDKKGWRLIVQTQIAVALCSIVLLGFMFASLPLLSPLVNILAIPWFSWILTPLALLASVFPFPKLQWFAAILAEYTLQAIQWLAQYAPEFAVALAPWPLFLLALLAIVLLLLPYATALRPFAWLVLIGFIFYRPKSVEEGHLKVMVMDAGQGLSVLMQTRDNNLLFDTGTDSIANSTILPSLNALGIRHLDKLILSHHDVDHDGGFSVLEKRIHVQQIQAGQPEFYPQAQWCQPSEWEWNQVHFELLRPSEKSRLLNDNEKSCVLRVIAGEDAFLVTGDLGQKGEHALIEEYGDVLYSQILVLGHHGSNTASSGKFLNTVSPQYAVSSSGYANAYKHPSVEVKKRLAAHHIELLQTDLSGALLFELGDGKWFKGRLKNYKPYWQKKPFDNNNYQNDHNDIR